MNTTPVQRVARIDCAWVQVIAILRNIRAGAILRIAHVDGAGVIIVAQQRVGRVLARASGRIAMNLFATIALEAIAVASALRTGRGVGHVSVAAADRVIAEVGSTGVGIIARQVDVHMGAAGQSTAGINRAHRGVIAGNRVRPALPCSQIAGIGGARIVIITLQIGVRTTTVRHVAGRHRTWQPLITNLVYPQAVPCERRADVKGAFVPVVARDRGPDALSGPRVALVRRTGIAVIAIDRDRVARTRTLIAEINRATIQIVTRDWLELAKPRGRVASVACTNVAVVTHDKLVGTRSNTRIAQVDRAGILVVASSRSEDARPGTRVAGVDRTEVMVVASYLAIRALAGRWLAHVISTLVAIIAVLAADVSADPG